jgi:N-acetyl-anhydromuramyl-L-alanine amidase AmpD
MNIVNIPSKSNHKDIQFKPKGCIVHAMGEFIEAGEEDYFAKEFLDLIGLSAHYLVTPSGVIIQCRELHEIAYHAKGANSTNVGIEILVSGVHTYSTFTEAIKKPYMTTQQITAFDDLVKYLESKGISRNNYQRHSTISPGRKVDPGDGFQSRIIKI